MHLDLKQFVYRRIGPEADAVNKENRANIFEQPDKLLHHGFGCRRQVAPYQEVEAGVVDALKERSPMRFAVISPCHEFRNVDLRFRRGSRRGLLESRSPSGFRLRPPVGR
jgi:hypothetical protein